jgi:hypothetical protein
VYKRQAQGIACLVIAIGIPTTPIIGNIASRFTDNPKTKATIADIATLVVTVLGVGRAAQGRIYANGPAYTPDILPGLDKADAEALINNSSPISKETNL